MKAFASALLLIALCYPVSAADQFVGTYKLNPAKSAASGGQVPPDLTLTISEDGGNLLIATSAKAADGSLIPSDVLTVPKAGGTVKAPQGASYDSTKVSRKDPNTIDVVAMQNGKERTRVKFALSRDGKTLTRSFTSTNAKGLPVSGTSVLERE
jgi:hypothetical protein